MVKSVWIACLCLPLLGQPEARFESFSTSRGLLHNHVKSLFQDSRGYLWIGTLGGASRFDGKRFDNHELVRVTGSNAVIAYVEWADILVAATPNGLAFFENEQFVAAPFNQAFSKTTIKSLHTTQSHTWIATRDGLYVVAHAQPRLLNAIHELQDQDVNSVFCDANGRVWVATRGSGLKVREDGRWSTFTKGDGLPTLLVNQVVQTPDGTIWVATHQGVVYFDGQAFRPPPFADEVPSPIIYGFLVDQSQRLWLRTSLAGVACWDGVNLTTYDRRNGLPSPINLSLMQDQEGRIWASCHQGLAIFDRGSFQILNEQSGLNSPLVNCVYQDRQGGIWVGTAAGLNRFEENQFTIFMQESSKAMTPHLSRIYSIFKDTKRRLWFPSHVGLGLFDGSDFSRFDMTDGLPQQEIHGVVEDRNGIIWVATTKGAARYVDGSFRAVEDPNLHHRPISQIQCDRDGNIWFLRSDLQLFRMGPGQLVSYPAPLDTDVAAVREIVMDSDGLPWFKARDRYITFSEQGMQQVLFADIAPDLVVYSGLPSSNGTLWLGTNRGLVAYGRHKANFISLDTLSSSHVLDISRSEHGELWLSLAQPGANESGKLIPFGVGRYDGISLDLFPLEQSEVTGFRHTADQTTWVLMQNGVVRIKEQSSRAFGIADGLAGNAPSAVLRDGLQNTWIATRGGLSKFRADLVTNYDADDGLFSGDVTDLAFDEHGGLWVRTRRGVQRYRENQVLPRVEVVSIETPGLTVDHRSPFKLGHNQNNLTIQFRGISLARGSEKMQYRYKLVGDERGWIGPISETKVHLNQLSPGKYKFIIQALSRDLYACREPAVVKFEILPPIWMTPWFVLASLLTLGFLGFVGYRRRLAFRLEQNRISNELLVANQMQMSLMPKCPPVVDRLDVYGICRPALEVGGDYFDYFEFDDNDLGIAVVDVSGKSMEAAMIAILTSGLLYGEVNRDSDPSLILSRMNGPIYQKTKRSVFSAALFARFICEPTGIRVRLANAGQLRPLLIRDDQIKSLRVDGIHLPLGVLPEVRYPQADFDLRDNDILVFFTDGVNEMMNRDMELFGMDRVRRVLETAPRASARQTVDHLLKALERFANGQAPNDDVTIVAVRIHGAPEHETKPPASVAENPN